LLREITIFTFAAIIFRRQLEASAPSFIAEETQLADAPDSWQAWLARHGPALVLYARQWVAGCSHADAEDAAQEGFVRFWKSCARAADPLAYLYTCVRSAAMDQHRQGVARRAHDQVAMQRQPAWFEASSEAISNVIDVQSALGELPEGQREVVILKIWGGLTFAQIGDVAGIASNTAASRYRYAMEKLEAILSDEVKHE
jgi:RNA polymerase sigma-70 factor (ECF subfamily)